MGAYIKAISYYLPETVLTNEALVREFPEWSVDKVAQKVGVHSRHLAGEHETAGDMAERAARRLFDEYTIDPKEVDFLLLCTQSPDYFFPSTACILQNRLGLRTDVGAFDYNLGCSGCVYGLAVAKGLIAGGIARNVLLLTAETYNKYLHPSDKSNRSIFGDGAAACLISTDGFAKIGAFGMGTDGSGAEHLILKTGAARWKMATGLSVTDDEGHVWHDDYLYMNGSEICTFTLDIVPPLVNITLANNGLEKEMINQFVFHQANKYMLNFLRKKLKIEQNRFYYCLSQFGNTVSSSIPIALREAIDDGIIRKGDKALLAGFGVGYFWAGTILRL